MTICFPNIITTRICPRDELQFSNTPPTCVTVVPIYNDAVYVVSQFPPPVHFLVTDNGMVYQLADIQSPPSTPPEYHALLDPSGCILVGVEFSSITNAPITNSQIRVLPGVLRYILTTLGLPIASVTNQMPVPRCRRQLWQEIVNATLDCLQQTPPPPPTPPSLSCAFVLSCLTPGQNVNITTGGTINAGQLVEGPNPGQYTWVLPNGTPSFSFSPGGSLSVLDTLTVDLTLAAGPTLSANVIVSPVSGNQIQVLPTGLYVPPAAFNVADTPTIDLTFASGNLSADVIVSPAAGNQLTVTPLGLYVPPSALTPCLNTTLNVALFPVTQYMVLFNPTTLCIDQTLIPQDAVLYGDNTGAGFPAAAGLLYRHGTTNFLRLIDATTPAPPLLNNSVVAYSGASTIPNGTQVVGALGNAGGFGSVTVSFVNMFAASFGPITSSVVVGQGSSVQQAIDSVLTIQNSNINTVIGSFVHAGQTTIGAVGGSHGSVDGNGVLDDAFFSLFAVQLSPNTLHPSLSQSTVNSRDSFQSITGPVQISFTHAILDNATINESVNYSFIQLTSSTIENIGGAFFRSVVLGVSSRFGAFANSFATVDSLPPNQILFISSSLFFHRPTTPSRIGPNNPSIASSAINSFGAAPNARSAVLFSVQSLPIENVFTSLIAADNIAVADPNPPNNQVTFENAVIAGSQIAFPTNVSTYDNLIAVGFNLRVGTSTILALGRNSVTPPAVQAAGGYTVLINDGDPNNNFYEAWGDGLFRPRNFLSFPNDANAATALNAAYGPDPRTNFGTMIAVNVNGTPAIFAWNGSSFVRITV